MVICRSRGNSSSTALPLKVPSTLSALWPNKSKDGETQTVADSVIGSIATHALVFQITTTGRGGRQLQRVVGIHPTRDCTADHLDDLFWGTVERLKMHAGISVVGATCDGGSANRLMMKMNTSDLGYGTPNHFIQAWCWNFVEPWRKLWFISDPSHCHKKPANNWEKSGEGDTFTKLMMMPEPIVEAVLSQVVQVAADKALIDRARADRARRAQGEGDSEPDPGTIAHLAGMTKGHEAFIYIFGSIYSDFTDPKPYMANSPEALERDRRVVELRFLLKVLRAWHTYNEGIDVREVKTSKERASWGLSHQLFFDMQMEIEGFLGFLHEQITEHGSVCMLARKVSQDSLESLFGMLRYACGGNSAPSILQVANGTQRAEAQMDAKHRVMRTRQQKQNCGRENETRTKLSSWEAVRATAKRQAAAEAIEEVLGPRKKQARFHFKEPAGFDATWQRHLLEGAQPAKPYEVTWLPMKYQ